MTNQQQSAPEQEEVSSSRSSTLIKCLVAGVLLISAVATYVSSETTATEASDASASTSTMRRRLSMMGSTIPSYVEGLMTDLKERKKLFDETPPEEVKYWFEYTGPLQVSRVVFVMLGVDAVVEPVLVSLPLTLFLSSFSHNRNISIAFQNPVARPITLKAATIRASRALDSPSPFWDPRNTPSFLGPPPRSIPKTTNRRITDCWKIVWPWAVPPGPIPPRDSGRTGLVARKVQRRVT